MKVDDAGAGSDRGDVTGRAGLGAGEDSHNTKRCAGAHAATDHVQVTRFKHLQLQRTAGQQHCVQRKQRQLGCRGVRRR